jgi:acyl-CoA synthetase (AMP-forming)/AMP-acid ligase II
MYIRLMRYFESRILNLSEAERRGYINGARGIRVFLCGTSALPAPVQKFWTGILGGRQILTRFGGTEFHAVLKAGLDGGAPMNSVGTVSPGVDVKLSEEGMVLVRGPNLLSKYVSFSLILDAKWLIICRQISQRRSSHKSRT